MLDEYRSQASEAQEEAKIVRRLLATTQAQLRDTEHDLLSSQDKVNPVCDRISIPGNHILELH